MQKSSLIAPGHTYHSITEKIADTVLTRSAPKAWYAALGVGLGLLALFGYAVWQLFTRGVGIWGVNQTVGWGYDITNLVWWIGIGHAGTLISAILLLFRQKWRTAINRFAEAMTLFAIACALLFPVLHVGRPWLVYWSFPYPNTFGLWPNFRSPLLWDAFALNIYGIVSLLFWYVGLIPDLAALRDRAVNPLARYFYAFLALGWRGSAAHWQRYETAYRLLAGLATALVVGVSAVVSLDFAAGLLPGWHSTIFPPYFLAGATFCGFAMVLLLLIPLRKIYQLEDFITTQHLDSMAKMMLGIGLFVVYCYLTEGFTAWYSGNPNERFWLSNRTFGPYWWVFGTLLLCNVVIPQALWWQRVRTTPGLLLLVALAINIGMWLERYMIIVVSLHRDFLPSAWSLYAGTFWDQAIFLGTIGIFLIMIVFFIRLLPMISIFEMRQLLAETQPEPGQGSPAEPSVAPSLEAKRPSSATPSGLHGLMAEFADSATLLTGVRKLYAAGYRQLAAYTPFPVEELPAALGLRPSRLPWLVLLGGIVGAVGGFYLQYYAAAIYPLNIGGRPLNSWPSFLIVTFVLMILGAAAVAALGMIILNGLPQLYHAVFNAPRFQRASQDRFFLCVEARDPQFALEKTWQALAALQPDDVVAVEK